MIRIEGFGRGRGCLCRFCLFRMMVVGILETED